MDRAEQLRRWLAATLGGGDFSIAPASDDASFRRYFRIRRDEAQPSLVVMDAPPDKENCGPFVHVAHLLAEAGVHVPEIFAQDLEQGFLLLSDLGSTTYLDALDEHNAGRLYEDALDALLRIQRASRPGLLPDYSRELLERELRLFPDWYVGRQLRRELDTAQLQTLEKTFSTILDNNLAQARVFVHRDYHSRNLMVCEPCPGILDFQDAVYGPITYDLVSLLRDAYIAWDEERVIDWAVRYWERARGQGLPVGPDFADFYRDFEWMGAQRQLKVLGIFARLSFRDGKDGYLKDQPLVMSYLRRTCGRYPELAALGRLLEELERQEKRVGHTF
ncbi:MAG: aminoglycoside phosphotransferase [Betaproteobacteria bacterium]|nr:MAG: aminoglycoside phosphotransferase [Betaproteobacteria bacterium]